MVSRVGLRGSPEGRNQLQRARAANGAAHLQSSSEWPGAAGNASRMARACSVSNTWRTARRPACSQSRRAGVSTRRGSARRRVRPTAHESSRPPHLERRDLATQNLGKDVLVVVGHACGRCGAGTGESRLGRWPYSRSKGGGRPRREGRGGRAARLDEGSGGVNTTPLLFGPRATRKFVEYIRTSAGACVAGSTTARRVHTCRLQAVSTG